MMKKLLLTTILMTSMIACYKDDAILNESPQAPLTKSQAYRSGNEYVKMKRHKITPNRALTIAEEAKALFSDENERLLRTRSIGLALTPVAITSQAKGRSAGGVDTLLYIVNYSNNNGFVFVSNDDRDGEVLMYAGDGNFAMQDTTGNPGLKLHVEMVLAYQAHKLNEIKSAEARGEEYIGGMTTTEVDDLPTMLMAPNDTGTPGVLSMPGAQGHTCNVTGQPSGMPGVAGTPARKDICAPATYESKYWEGDVDAIELAQKKYKNQKCFGVPVLPPSINFMTGGEHGNLGTPGEAPLCESKPYCAPPLWNYKEYYGFYGAKMSMLLRTVKNLMDEQVKPLLTTCWDQDKPLRLNFEKNSAGCGPIAVAQIMMYHKMPKTYNSQAFGGTYKTEIDEIRKLRTNENIENSHYFYAAWNFIQEIAERLDVTYKNNGSTSVNMFWGTGKIQDTFKSFGYSIGYEGAWNYQNNENFWRVVESLQYHNPVFLHGYPQGTLGPQYMEGHLWVLDGYKQIINRYYYADYYFDEYGKFNAENRYTQESILVRYVHANLGWGEKYLPWVAQGVYDFAGSDFSGRLYYIAGIKPRIY